VVHSTSAVSPTHRTSNQDGLPGIERGPRPPATALPIEPLSSEQRIHPFSATFRNILAVVFLIFVFAVVQMVTLWAVCNIGMKTAATLEHQGLPALNELASLQEHLAIYRLHSYEVLFAQEDDRARKMKTAETVAAQTHVDLDHIKLLFPDGEGQLLAVALRDSFDDLDTAFGKVRGLVDVDFAAAMKAMDQDIPPRIERVAAAASALKDYGYRFSGGQANATVGSFAWIKKNAVAFGVGNILVALGAVVFVQLAARRSRAQLSATLARLDERTQELAGSLSIVNATLDATADGIMLIDTAGQIGNFNRRFAAMWTLPADSAMLQYRKQLRDYVLPLLQHPEKLSGVWERLAADPAGESSDVIELADGRCFELVSKPQLIQGQICGRVWSTRDITAQKRMQQEVEQAHAQLVVASRRAGMAEVATGVLHNVGNVLNSVNVSATLIADQVRHTKAGNIAKVAALFTEHQADLAAFLTHDARGQMLPTYLGTLAESLADEQRTMIAELAHLRKNIEHIKDIVAMQQAHARSSGVIETISVTDLADDALGINAAAFARHGVETSRDYQSCPAVTTDRHKVMQILVNLVTNAKHACSESGRADKRIVVRIASEGGRVKISVSDNGIGIPAENLTRIFNYGFTTKKTGHGFGLHSGALAAKELGGALSVQSAGPGHGATFTLELPAKPDNPAASLP